MKTNQLKANNMSTAKRKYARLVYVTSSLISHGFGLNKG